VVWRGFEKTEIVTGLLAYVAPFLAQAKEVAREYLKRYAAPIIAGKNQGELWVELMNRPRIRLHGADNPDRLRGNYLDGVVLDEFGDMRPSIWGGVIRSMLADRLGWATFIGTPKGAK
jgi:phage terminase large subunit